MKDEQFIGPTTAEKLLFLVDFTEPTSVCLCECKPNHYITYRNMLVSFDKWNIKCKNPTRNT
jgi:hypothetical protein